jgi:hypothetical protein
MTDQTITGTIQQKTCRKAYPGTTIKFIFGVLGGKRVLEGNRVIIIANDKWYYIKVPSAFLI